MGLLETLLPGLGNYVILAIVLAPIIIWFVKRMQKIALIEKIPGPKAIPILGNALEVNVEPRVLFQKFLEFCTYGNSVSRVWLGLNPYVFLYEAKATETLLSSTKHIDKSRDYKYVHPWLGTGLLTSTGKKWHSRRKLLTPAFHFKILEDFIDVFNRQSETFVKKLDKLTGNKEFNIFPMCTLCTLDVILETAMGLNLDVQNDNESEYVDALYKLGALIQYRQARPWLDLDIMFYLFGNKTEHDRLIKILHNFSSKTIKDRKTEFQKAKKNKTIKSVDDDDIGKKKRLAFLDLMLEYSDENESLALTDEELREEVDTFMFEGHDTTASAINWTLYLLGTHPKIQARVHEELDRLFGDDDRLITSNDIREMKVLENCVKESLRLFPSVPFLGRELKEEVIFNGYRVPAGTTALIITYKLHRDPKHFPNPEVFDPDRFNAENSSKRHPYAYVPFSAGPRNCIGQKFAQMEEKVILANLLRKFRFESNVRREDLSILGELILRPEAGNQMTVYRR